MAWQNGLMDLAMPFMIQFMKDYVGKVDTLMADRKENMEARKVHGHCITTLVHGDLCRPHHRFAASSVLMVNVLKVPISVVLRS